MVMATTTEEETASSA